MCIEDVLIGKATFTFTRTLTVGTTAIEAVKVSRDRRLLIFGGASAGVITVGPGSTVVAGAGYRRTTAPQPLILLADHVGNLVAQSWFAVADDADRVIAITEGVFDEHSWRFVQQLKFEYGIQP